jgi:hypothetical protein
MGYVGRDAAMAWSAAALVPLGVRTSVQTMAEQERERLALGQAQKGFTGWALP